MAVAAVPKKCTSISKNIWKRKGYWAGLKAFSLAKSLYTGKSKSFFVGQFEKGVDSPTCYLVQVDEIFNVLWKVFQGGVKDNMKI